MRIGVLASHPIQYQAPIFRELATRCDLVVYFAHRQTPQGQAEAGFGVPFEWDTDLLSGYRHVFLKNVSTRPDPSRFGGCDTPEAGRLITEGRFDAFVTLGWNLKSYWQAVAACRKRGVRILARGDSQLNTPAAPARRLLREATHRLMLRRFDAFLSVGERSRAYLLHYGVAPERIFRSPHCVDNAWFEARSRELGRERASLRASFGIPAEATAVLFAGKLIEKKRPADLVGAASRLRRDGRDIRLFFAGSGPLEAALKAACGAAGVPASWAGFVNQSRMPECYAAADVLALPSDGRETWGLVVNEALASGLPCVVSDEAGCAPDLVASGRTGETHRCGDAASLAAALRAVLDRGPRRGAASLRETVAGYSPASAAEGLLAGCRGTRA